MNVLRGNSRSVLGRLAMGLVVAVGVVAVAGSTGCDEEGLDLSLGSPLTGSLDIGLSPTGIDLEMNAPLGIGSMDIETGLCGTSVTCTGPAGETGPCS